MEDGINRQYRNIAFASTLQYLLCMARSAVLWPISRVVAVAGLRRWMLSL